jgi:hypothetical protein
MSRRPGMAGDDLRSKARRARSRMRSATKQWIPAPANDSQTVNGAVLGAFGNDGERVEWVYTILPDGSRIVTGYDILPILPTTQKAPDFVGG